MSKHVYILDDTHKAFFLYSGNGDRFGLIVEHDCVDGPVEDLLPFREEGYILVEEDPLSLDRYIICHECGDYGCITEGEWQPYVQSR